MPRRRSILTLQLLVCSLTAAPKPVTLVDKGKPLATIVVASDASPSEKRAAGELRQFVQEMSGALLPIRTEGESVAGAKILLGQSPAVEALSPGIPFDRLGAEGFALKTVGPHLIIAGGRRRGTMYGVSAFLEKLGCRWVAPDASYVPKRSTIRVEPLDETQTPAFEYRDIYIAEAWDKDWAARNRVNGAMARLDESTGGKIEYYPFVHSFYQLIPPQKHFKEHPEYFALVDGKRRDDRAQLCLTNPELVRVAAEQVERWIAEHPSMTISSVSQMDWGGDCECDNCRKVKAEEGGASSGTLLRFINALAEQVEKKHPDKLIDTLAYFYTEEPPAKTRPRRNVRVRMCPIGACQAHPYQTCPHDAYIMKNLKGWAKITNQIYIWHYNANFSHFLLPVPDFDELAADIEMYHSNGVVGLFMQGTGMPGGESGRLRAYVLSRLLWNPRADVRKAIDEFHEIYYGPAARPMRAWFDLLHGLMRMPPAGEGQHIWCCRAPDLSDTQMKQAQQAFQDALAAAGSDVIRRRVELAQLAVRYMELQRMRQFVVRDGSYESRGLTRLKQEIEPLFADFKRLGVERLGEEHDVKFDHDAIATTLRTYPVVTIENSRLRLDIVPELHGRVVRMVDKTTGRERLNQPNPVEMAYPDRSGWGASAYAQTFEAAPLPLDWRVESSSSSQVVLTARTGAGLRLRRVLRLVREEPSVEEELTAENRGAAECDAVLESQLDADAGRLQDAALRFSRRNGEAFERLLV
ncbi:MAG: DUF4838 domain-containing protein, partial [Acidobacteria bacterium]|nr:DUF4838 domain-containing protein [Acidobacteriota bacterium]